MFLLISSLLWTACSTSSKKKAVEYPKGFKKLMHNLTARFNGYHNAKLIVKESITNLSDQYQDNYNQVLALYKESAIEDAQSAYGQLDEATKKSSIVISLHRPSKWADDSYFLIGQSQYLKKEYEAARETFDFIVKEYDPKNIAAKKAKYGKKKKKKKTIAQKKKEEEKLLKEKKYALKHRPIRKTAMVWLARTYVEEGNYDDAMFTLRKLKNDTTLIKRLQAETAIVESYVHLKQKKYKEAIPALERGIDLIKKKKKKNRFTYILAQIYQFDGNSGKAAELYAKVLKMRPEYDMEFRTRLNMILNEWESGVADAEPSLNKLKRMSKDIKNEEFKDQIYFAMANINLEEEDQIAAIDNLKKSIQFNQTNQPQKADSYLKLAEIYYDLEKYVNSKKYYDSTLTVISTSDDRYGDVANWKNTLKDIAEQIEIVELQDSLIAISNMNDDDRLALAKKLKKEQLEKGGKTNGPRRTGPKGQSLANAIPSPSGASNTKSNWWAYDQNQVKKGVKEFEKKWGSRKLEDDWRRSNRRSINLSEEEEIASVEARIFVSEEEMKTIFKDVPDSPEKLKRSNEKIEEALFTLGNLYRDRIDNEPKSIEAFEEVISRYPKGKFEVEALYALYLMYDNANNRNLANQYKNRVTDEYPLSRYAEVISNPNAASAFEKSEAKLTDYYNDSYAQFSTNQYQQALSMVNSADSLFGSENKLQPKFSLLGAMCIGNIDGKEAYKIALQKVITDYPDTDEQKKAQEILKYLGGSSSTGNATNTNPNDIKDLGDVKLYQKVEDGLHYILIKLSGKEVKLSDAKVSVTDYNTKYHKLANHKISSLLLDLNTPIMIVRKFRGKNEAMKYLKEIEAKRGEFLEDKADKDYKAMIISQDNYKILLRLRQLDSYVKFFDENYGNQ